MNLNSSYPADVHDVHDCARVLAAGKKLVCCTKEGLKFAETEDEKKAREELASSFEPLCRLIKVCMLLCAMLRI